MNFKTLLVLAIIALYVSPGESLFIKKKLLLGKIALKSKLAAIAGAKAKAKAAVLKLGKGIGIGYAEEGPEFDLVEDPILIPHPEPVVQHYFVPPPPQVIIPPQPPPQVYAHEPITYVESVEPSADYSVSVPLNIEEKPVIGSWIDSIKEKASEYNPLNLLSWKEEQPEEVKYNFIPKLGFSHYKKVNYRPVVPIQVIHPPPPSPVVLPPPTIISPPFPPVISPPLPPLPPIVAPPVVFPPPSVITPPVNPLPPVHPTEVVPQPPPPAPVEPPFPITPVAPGPNGPNGPYPAPSSF